MSETDEAPRIEVKEADRVAVVLKNPHTHAGVQCNVGETIRVRAAQAAWLRTQGIID